MTDYFSLFSRNVSFHMLDGPRCVLVPVKAWLVHFAIISTSLWSEYAAL